MNAEPKKLDMIREIYKNNHNIIVVSSNSIVQITFQLKISLLNSCELLYNNNDEHRSRGADTYFQVNTEIN